MPISYGNKKISTIKYGDRVVKEVWYGNTLRYQSAKGFMVITIIDEQQIDLSALNGIGRTIDWGDGTVDQSLIHTYYNAGSYTIKANFAGVTSVDDGFLFQCRNLKSVNINGFDKMGGKTFGSYMLTECDNLESVTIKPYARFASFPTFDTSCFCNDPKLTYIDLYKLNGVTFKGEVFNGCSSLNDLDNLPYYLTFDEPYNLFKNCTELTSIDFSDKVLDINGFLDNCFSGCTNLKTITLTSSSATSFINTTIIGDNFCYGCSSLQSAGFMSHIRNTQKIGDNFMYGCNKITGIDLSKTSLYYWDGASARNRTIGQHFLQNCSNLQYITLPSATTHGDFTYPADLGSWGTGLDSLTTIHCEDDYSLNQYKTTNVWKEKASLMIK